MRIGTSDARGRAPRQDWRLKLPRTPLAAIAALAALGAAVWAVQACTPAQARASAVPEPADPAPECCSFTGADSPDGFWVTTLLPGQTYDFDLMPGSPLTPGGEWSASFGSVDHNGVYQAPTFAPPSGMDSVVYTTPEGAMATVWVRLEEAPGHSFELPYTVPDGFHSASEYISPERLNPDGDRRFAVLKNRVPSQELRESWAMLQWEQRDWIDVVPADGVWHPVRKASEPNEPGLAPVTDCTDIAAMESGGLLPVSTYVGTVERLDMLGVKSGSEGVRQKNPQRCRTGPVNPVPDWNGSPSTLPGATKRVEGPVKRFLMYLMYSPDAGSMPVTADLQADLGRLFNVDHVLGTEVRFGRHSYQYREFQTFDYYRCIDGRWKYVGTTVCERDSIGSRTDPRWANFLFGSPINGDPDGWSSWICNPLP